MQKIIIAAVLLAAVQSFSEFHTVKIEVSNGGAIVAVDPFQLAKQIKELANTEKTAYVEYLVFPPTGKNILADRGEGVPDVAVQKVVIEEKKEDVGIFEAAGVSIKKNAWAWAAGVIAAGVGVYAIGDSYGWWTRSSNDDPPAPPQIVNNGGTVIVTGDGSPVTIQTTTTTNPQPAPVEPEVTP